MNKVYNFIPPHTAPKELDGSNGVVRFRKQIIRFGDWIDPLFPDERMVFDLSYMETFKRNFDAAVVGRVSVPVGHPKDASELADMNRGELVAVEIVGDGSDLSDGLYGVIEIRDADTAGKIRTGTIWDDSISFTDDYVDNVNGQHHGPALLHVGLVNNPYIKDMGAFKELADSLKSCFNASVVRMLSESSNKETSMSKVKNDRDFPVELTYTKDGKEVTETVQPGVEIEVAEEQLETAQKAVADAQAPETDEQKAERDKQEAEAAAKAKEDLDNTQKGDQNEDKDLSDPAGLKRELAEAKAKLLDNDIDAAYQTQLKAGKIVPAQEDAYKALSHAVHGQTRQLSDGKTQNLSELLAEFVSKSPRVVDLDDEKGKTGTDSQKSPSDKLPEESKRGLAKMRVSAEDYDKHGSRESVSINELTPAGAK